MTLREALTVAAAQLDTDEHLRDTATRDAELLLLHTLQIPRTTLISHPSRELSADQRRAYEDSIARLCAANPSSTSPANRSSTASHSKSLPPSSSRAPKPNTSSKPPSN